MDYRSVIGYDYETPKGCFLASFYIPEEDRWYDFLINEYQNDLYKLVKFYEDHAEVLYLGFNCINFDAQVTEFILANYDTWFDKDGLYIAGVISDFAARIIDDQNYNIYPPYREQYFHYKQLDIPRVFHWFNENRRVGLKQAEFELRAESIENFEIPVDKESFTPEEVENLITYCHNDVRYTYEIYLYAMGECTHPLYSGKDKLYDRQVIFEELGLDCINWDDVKIGAEWNKLDYMNATGLREDQLKPDKVISFYGKKYRKYFPSTVSFQSEELNAFINKLGNTTILATKQEFDYRFSNDLVITLGRGGLHSNEKPRYLIPKDDEIFLQNDIGSQYPNALRKYGAWPRHLTRHWNDSIPGKIERRLHNKKQYKLTKDPKYNSLQEMGKLQLNGGMYGRLNTTNDWQQDPQVMLQVTIGCQLEVLMIVEALVLKGFHVTSCNTDGWDAIIPTNRLGEYFDIVEHYEKVIGNDTLGRIEFTEFTWMAQTSVNDYAAEKKGMWENRSFVRDPIVQKGSLYPSLKLKGDFTVEFELHKNSSFRIIPLAIVNHLVTGDPIAGFVMNHEDIFDFCARTNAGEKFYLEGSTGTRKDKQTFRLPKLVRYYVSKDGVTIHKMNKRTKKNFLVYPKEELKTACNQLPREDYRKHLLNVKRTWYIDKAEEIIFSLLRGRRPHRPKPLLKQLSLF